MWKGEFIGIFGAGFKIEGHRKLLFIGLYFFTICNIYIHYLSKDLRKSIKKKTGQYGPRGNRGMRGKSGKPSSCEGGCGDSLCYKKIAQFHQKCSLMRDCSLFRRLLLPEYTVFTSHSAYVATATESDGVKIDGLLPPNFL